MVTRNRTLILFLCSDIDLLESFSNELVFCTVIGVRPSPLKTFAAVASYVIINFWEVLVP